MSQTQSAITRLHTQAEFTHKSLAGTVPAAMSFTKYLGSPPLSARAMLFGSWSVAPNPSIERTFQRPLRALWPAAHVER